VTLVETTTRTDSRDVKDQKGLPAKEPPLSSTTVEEKHETTETKSHSTDSSPATPPKVSHLAGLLYSFDDADPQDIVMGPQYEVEVSVGSELFLSISRMMKWGSKSLEGARGEKNRYEEWEKAAREFRYPRNFPLRMTKLLRHLGEFESVRTVTVPKESEHPDEGQTPGGTHLPEEGGKMTTKFIGYGGGVAPPLVPRKDEPKRLIGTLKWIKHGEVLAVDVFGPRPLYVFRLAKGKDAASQDSQAGKTH